LDQWIVVATITVKESSMVSRIFTIGAIVGLTLFGLRGMLPDLFATYPLILTAGTVVTVGGIAALYTAKT